MTTAIIGGKIFIEIGKYCQGILVEDGIVKKTGTSEEILKCIDDETKIIDLEGKTAVPGFNDSHVHVLSLAKVISAVHLHTATSPQDLIDFGKEFIVKNNVKKGDFIRGRGWNQDYFTTDKRLPTCKDLDQISTENPIIYVRACGHMMVCNSYLLKMAGITRDSEQVDGGEFYFFPDGEPNGIFSEYACDIITSFIPKLDSNQIADTLKTGFDYISQYGITSVHTHDIQYPEIDEIVEGYRIYHKGGATARVYHQCGLDTVENIISFTKKYGASGSENDFGTVGPLKMLIDGSLGARTALMRKPYADDPTTNGIFCYTDEHVDEMVKTANENGMQVAIHAIGDLGVEKVLDAYKKVSDKENSLRHGIVHCQITGSDLIDRIEEQNVLAYVQPIFVHYDQHIVKDRVGEELASTSYSFGSMYRRGIHTSYGTDSPVENPFPLDNIYTAVTRCDLRGNGPYREDEKVSVEEAIDQYTRASAYASFTEDKQGTLNVGYYADLAVLDKDIFTVDPMTIKDIKVDMTILGGKIVYQR